MRVKLCVIFVILILCSGCSQENEKESITNSETISITEAIDTKSSPAADSENLSETVQASDSQSDLDETIPDMKPDHEETAVMDNYYTATGYVLYTEGDFMYVDEENTGSRTYPSEGEDRKIAYNISNADITVEKGTLRTALKVDITYYELDNQRYAVSIFSDGWEEMPGGTPIGEEIHSIEGTIEEMNDDTIVIYYEDSQNENSGYIRQEFDISEAEINTSIELKEYFTVFILYQKSNGINKAIEIRDIS